MVRFERSTLFEHKGTRTIVLRVLKIVKPVNCVIAPYDGYICWPEEGKLHRKSRYDDEKAWSIDIDKSKDSGLQLLWDT